MGAVPVERVSLREDSVMEIPAGIADIKPL
jgi:hypothetical protein